MTLNIKEEIKRQLRERRPERYTPGPGSSKWLDDIADDLAHLEPPETAQRNYARALVKRLEGEATKDANKIIRACMSQPPLDWDFFRGLPLVVGKERVAIRAARADDFLQFSREERQRNAKEFVTREETVRGAEFIAEYMIANSIDSGASLQW